jgi:hypothetical protein
VKREAIQHTKMIRLARKLSLERWGAVGIMESFWKLVEREAPTGDISRLTDEDVADGIGWISAAHVLIEALEGAGFIDSKSTDTARILWVHDWPEHCEDAVHSKLARAGLLFCDGKPPKLTKLTEKERPAAETRIAEALRRIPAAGGGRRRPKTADVRTAARNHNLTLPSPLPSPSPDPLNNRLLSADADLAPKVRVFHRWREVTGHVDAKFTPKRERAVEGRLAQGYTVEQLFEAISGCKASPFHQGKNENGTVFDDLELICRNGEKVEKFLAIARQAPQQTRDESIEQAAMELLAETERGGTDAGD